MDCEFLANCTNGDEGENEGVNEGENEGEKRKNFLEEEYFCPAFFVRERKRKSDDLKTESSGRLYTIQLYPIYLFQTKMIEMVGEAFSENAQKNSSF